MIDRATGGLAFWRRMTCLLIWLLQAYSGAGCSVPFFYIRYTEGKLV